MKRTAQIFKKDAAHLWPQILAFIATLGLFACNDPTYVTHNLGFVQLTNLLFLLLPLSCWLLVTSLMQGEKAVGHEQYWLTRPFTRVDLIAAKALFLLASVVLPVLVCQLLVLRANGLSPFVHFGDLLIKQLFFIALIVLPVAALATVTRNLGHAFLGGLLFAAGLGVFAAAMASLISGSSWGGLHWMLDTAAAAVALCGSAAVIYLQYTRRRAVLGRTVLGCAGVLFVLVYALPPCQPAFTMLSWFSKQAIDPQAVRIAFDPRPDALPHKFPNARVGDVYLAIPIRLENVPADLWPASEWMSVESPWRSGWSAVGGIRGDNRWLTVKAGAYTGDVIRLRGSVDLRLSAVSRRTESYCVSSTSPWFGPLEGCSGMESPAAYIRRSFDLGPLRPADYLITVE